MSGLVSFRAPAVGPERDMAPTQIVRSYGSHAWSALTRGEAPVR
jgi:hypothetical protein